MMPYIQVGMYRPTAFLMTEECDSSVPEVGKFLPQCAVSYEEITIFSM
jgi:hypothetical protein